MIKLLDRLHPRRDSWTLAAGSRSSTMNNLNNMGVYRRRAPPIRPDLPCAHVDTPDETSRHCTIARRHLQFSVVRIHVWSTHGIGSSGRSGNARPYCTTSPPASPASRSLHLGQQQQHPSKPTSTHSTLAACARAVPLKGRRRAGVQPSCGTDAGERRSVGRGCPTSRDRCAQQAGIGPSSALWGLGAATEPLARLAA